MSLNKIKIDYDFSKALERDSGFQMTDVTMGTRQTYVKPRLLTALLGGEINTERLETENFNFDDVVEQIVLPSGKAFTDYGPDIPKNKARRIGFSTGSYGLRANVSPQDRRGMRMPNTNQLMTREYLLAEMANKSAVAWELFKELQIKSLLTTYTNDVMGGPQASFNFWNELRDGAVPTPAPIDTTNTGGDYINELLAEKSKLRQDIEKAGDSYDRIIVICGTTFFDQLSNREAQEGLARDLRSSLDLASMAVPRSNFNEGSPIYDFQNMVVERVGMLFIRYEGIILGNQLIGDDDAYMIPMGTSGLMRTVYSPAATEQYTNTVALDSYAWREFHDRRGTTLATESNVLYMLPRPEFIRPLVVAPAA